MNKVITVHTYVNNFTGEFGEMTFPELDAALNSGYYVKSITPVILSANPTNNCYSLVFLLQK